MPPLGFTDEELDALTALAAALPPAVRASRTVMACSG
jgi:hypothetical protein